MFARIVAIDLVDDLSIRLEGAEPVREPFRYEKLVAQRCAQDESNVPAVSRRSGTDIDRDIENRSGGDAHELGLAGRRNLKMQPTDDEAVHRQRMIFLDERHGDAVLAQPRFAVNLRKEAAHVV